MKYQGVSHNWLILFFLEISFPILFPTKAILEKAETREKAGRNSFEAGWQAALETMLLLMEKYLLKHTGQLLPMQIESNKDCK